MGPRSVAPTPVSDVDKLLQHYEAFGVIICRPCQFAIQPSALASHLLKHQIYRNERRKLMARLSHLELREPADVPKPEPLSKPIPELRILKGRRCLSPGCGYLCTSDKRMSQHWSDLHGERESRNVLAQFAWLQTFFKGNKIRYFEVSAPQENALSPITESTDDNTSPAARSHLPPPLDMDAMRYLLHFVHSTSLTLPRAESESLYFWSVQIPNEALAHSFLMYGVLSLAATHLAFLETDTETAKVYADAASRYEDASLADFQQHAQSPSESNAVALLGYARCLGTARLGRKPEHGGVFTSTAQMAETFHLIQSSIETMMSLQKFLPDGSDFKIPVEELEELGRLADEDVMLKDAQSVMHIPPAVLQRLDTLPDRLNEALPQSHARSLSDVQACLSANTALISAFARAYSFSPSNPSFTGSAEESNTVATIWAAIESWVRFVPDHYVYMLEQSDPAALIIFAHFCVLVKRFHAKYWQFQGLANRLIRLVEVNLESNLKHFVADLYTLLDDTGVDAMQI
ncbi:hypothetical protein M409DRAFT_26234 [Zasmidium cellare ATCC 36951]|uniref:C2H2-type domain-containing protein n=1 Tax=Zasmidium cellare ATCC 36951 TaxID=1080233 RepID=A0A6A6C8W4_ZASCE|nr:uncharacterized protein M409DRAFT_26234 [Zasmidium cellare ATCC 36951]KAF2163627.1 hypothetical protein M409DRAFT_26234 [Zasmidium cellare ATCC 36951]